MLRRNRRKGLTVDVWAVDYLDQRKLDNVARLGARSLTRYLEMGGRASRMIELNSRSWCGSIDRCLDWPFCDAHNGDWLPRWEGVR
jgi:hypothetical protein